MFSPNNSLVYNIEGIIISKVKVFRLYSILKLNKFPETLESMLYIMTRNSFLTQSQFEIVKDKVDNLLKHKEKKI